MFLWNCFNGLSLCNTDSTSAMSKSYAENQKQKNDGVHEFQWQPVCWMLFYSTRVTFCDAVFRCVPFFPFSFRSCQLQLTASVVSTLYSNRLNESSQCLDHRKFTSHLVHCMITLANTAVIDGNDAFRVIHQTNKNWNAKSVWNETPLSWIRIITMHADNGFFIS